MNVTLRSRLSKLRCAWCLGSATGVVEVCPACGTVTHTDCRDKHPGCVTLGCNRLRVRLPEEPSRWDVPWRIGLLGLVPILVPLFLACVSSGLTETTPDPVESVGPPGLRLRSGPAPTERPAVPASAGVDSWQRQSEIVEDLLREEWASPGDAPEGTLVSEVRWCRTWNGDVHVVLRVNCEGQWRLKVDSSDLDAPDYDPRIHGPLHLRS